MIEKLIDSLQGMVDSVISAAPTVLTAILLLIFALVVAKIVERLLRAILVRVKLDTLLGKAGVDTALKKIGLQQQLSYFIPRLIYFLLLFLVAKTAADTLGLQAVSDAIGAFFNYLPNLITAILLLILGTTIGPFVGQTVSEASKGSGLEFGDALGRLVSALILFVVGIMAISQLKIDTEIIRLVAAFCLAAFALAFGLWFGLGTREITRNLVAGFYARKILTVGQSVELAGEKGTLVAVTPTHTMIESEERTVSISNSKILDEVVRQS